MIARRKTLPGIFVLLVWMACSGPVSRTLAAPKSGLIDFNRDVRRILSENCFHCHGPDAKERKGGGQALRLDLAESAKTNLGDGRRAIVPGDPARSEMIQRITTADVDDRMPPLETGKKLTASEIATLKQWIAQGANYSRHWSYVKPERRSLPKTQPKSWPRNAIDHFILARLNREKLKPSPEADRATLIRRVSLDLTGLPPSIGEVDQFLADKKPGAYERLVDRLLRKEAFGEHWARVWLDQARYADSSGYADDPPRTIWAYRDYVIRSLNANKPFDQFTIEQLAGDLLDNPTDEQLVATAFHRNTMTNNEGGTSDEEYRNVAIVDRVNTTMSVWMGTTMACAQCHNHKYDPITQEEYFRLFAILNNTADADKGDESPVLPLFTPEQKRQKQKCEEEIARLEKVLRTSTSALDKAQAAWEPAFRTDLDWQLIVPVSARSLADAPTKIDADGSIRFERGRKTDTYTLTVPASREKLTALRLDVFPDSRPPSRGVGHADGNFVVSRVLASIAPTNTAPAAGRFLRVELSGKEKILSLAEAQVFSGASNIARLGEAKQSSTAFDGPAKLAIDGKTDGDYTKAKSTTHTETSADPWWELDFKSVQSIDRIVLWNRTDGSQDRLSNFRVALLDEQRATLWEQRVASAPNPSTELRPDGARPVPFAIAAATFSQKDFNAADVLDNKDPKTRGWAIAPKFGDPHSLTLTLKTPTVVGPGSNLVVTIEQLSKYDFATIAQLKLMKTSDERADAFARVPEPVRAILRQSPEARSTEQREELRKFYLSIAPGLQHERTMLAETRRKLEEQKPYTTVPIYRELAADKSRKTHLQKRGNFLELGQEVTGGLPAFASIGNSARDATATSRLTLARWLVDRENPLTARVVANQLWESIFGLGLVRTSEEFGAQGELPSHPELIDWLAVELMGKKWDLKHLLRLMVTSASYRQSSRVTPELAAQDPDNRLLARGPRFRLSAEMIRDQALAVSGLLSGKMYGPPVKPPQPKMGLAAAFGSGTDWETSSGEDRHRRALYTMWRRSNPYPSMTTFDAPNREVCLVRRERSNTPLQALVTLNDPVYIEAAQALARKMIAADKTPDEKARDGFLRCASRPPTDEELHGLVNLYSKTLARFQADPAKANELATKPLGEAPKDLDIAELAAWTVVGNVLLNLDEMLMKR